jgi:hypothetical protein
MRAKVAWTPGSSSKSGAVVENRATRSPCRSEFAPGFRDGCGERHQEQRASGWFSSQLRQLHLFPRRICGIHAGLFRPINGFRADAADFSL